MTNQYFNKKTFCVVTGASKGFGRSLSLQLAEKFAAGSTMVITARSLEALESLKTEIETKHPGVQVLVKAMDLSAPDEKVYAACMQKWLIDSSGKEFDCAIMVHNAGALNDSSKRMVDTDSVSELVSYFNMNLVSTISLNCCFVKALADRVPLKLIINISSDAARTPYPTTGLYSTAKAARFMYFRGLAVDEPGLRIINYEPGPMRTDLFREVFEKSHNDQLKQMTAAMLSGDSEIRLLLPEESAEKLVKILELDTFTNGDMADWMAV